MIQPTTTDLVRDLLTTAAADVGWEVDLDQLPVTAAHTPILVINLIEASAAYLAALATTRILDNAAESLRTVMDGAADADLDWEAGLLTAVLDLTDLHGQDTGRTRRRLLAALHALHPEGATWPPPPPTASKPTNFTCGAPRRFRTTNAPAPSALPLLSCSAGSLRRRRRSISHCAAVVSVWRSACASSNCSNAARSLRQSPSRFRR